MFQIHEGQLGSDAVKSDLFGRRLVPVGSCSPCVSLEGELRILLDCESLEEAAQALSLKGSAALAVTNSQEKAVVASSCS